MLLISGALYASEGPDPRIYNIHQTMLYTTENYPPANYFDGEQLAGVSVELLHDMWRSLKLPQAQIEVLPWTRGYRQLETKSNAMLFTMSRTKEREAKFKWVGPVFSSTHVLVTKSKAPIKISEVKEVYEYNVATVRGDISEKSLHEINFPNDKMAKVANVKQAFLLLKNDRVELVMLSIHALHHVLADLHESKNRYKIVWQVNKIGNYFAFNKAVPDYFIAEFQQTLDSLEARRIEILKKYQLPEEEY